MTDAVPSAGALLAVQLDDMWASSSAALRDLTDDEYFWEPTSGCWSVRPRAEATRGWGSGDWVCEDAFPAPDPVPVTTIAWRVIHLAAWTEVYLDHAFGGRTYDLQDFEVPTTAAGGVASLNDAQRRWADEVRFIPADEAFAARPWLWGQDIPLGRIVSIMTLEYRHHLAEVALLRDLRRGHALLPPRPAKVDAPAWWHGEDG